MDKAESILTRRRSEGDGDRPAEEDLPADLPEAVDPTEVQVRIAIASFLICERMNTKDMRLAWISRGIDAAEVVVKKWPERVEGFYYMAVLKGRRAEYGGLSAFIEVKDVEEMGLRAAEIDSSYEDGAPFRLLALLYAKAPPWPTSVGDMDKGIEYAEKALAISDYPLNHLTMGEVLIEAEEYERARDELKLVLSAPRVDKWAREGERWCAHARKLLRQLNKKKN